MNTNIRCHKTVGASLKLFLDSMNFKSVWNVIDEDYDDLVVFPDKREKLLQFIKEAVEKTGFCPYHVHPDLKYKWDGTEVKCEKVGFDGRLVAVTNHENISGDFRLVLFESLEGDNWLTKIYSYDKEFPVGVVHVTGRPKAIIKGLGGEIINLFSHCRVKVLDNWTVL